MNDNDRTTYDLIRSGGAGFYEQKRGLIAVCGKEAVPFLDGMITNDLKTLEDGAQMLAAFPNAQGRLLAVVRVLRQGDRFLFETEEITREKVFQNLFRFTFAGDFFVEDLSEAHRCFELFGSKPEAGPSSPGYFFPSHAATSYFAPTEMADTFLGTLVDAGEVAISTDLHETLHIESGVPKYGVDMDDTTIVPELGLDGLISYNKGCYIGQEIIARIHFRGHVAKQLTGLTTSSPPYEGGVAEGRGGSLAGTEINSTDGKPAGRITSATYSPKLDKNIALAYVRYDYLAEGTELTVDGTKAVVTPLPFIN